MHEGIMNEQIFSIGDKVHNINLSSVNAPVTGGFPWHREDVATVMEFHPLGTKWNQYDNTGLNTYMIRYDRATWMTDEMWNLYYKDNLYPCSAKNLIKSLDVEESGLPHLPRTEDHAGSNPAV